MKTLEQWRTQCRATWSASVVDAPCNGDVTVPLERALSDVSPVEWQRGSLVCIKPNLTTAKSAEGSAITTPRDIVAALIREINRVTDGTCDIAIVESDSDGKIAATYDILGYTEMAQQFPNVRLVELGKERHYKVLMPDWCRTRMIQIPEILLNMDHFINVANLKRHIQERLTCTWKNSYGLPADHLTRMRYHQFMPPILFALNYLFWPDLSIIDARIGLGGTGPMSGFPVRFDKLIVSTNPLAADVASMRVIAEPPGRVPMLRHAMKRLRVKDQELRLVGDSFTPKHLPFVPWFIFAAVRFGLWWRRPAMYLENISLLFMLTGVALRMGKPTDFAGGGVQSLGTSLRVAWRFLTSIDLSEKVYE